MNPHAHPCRTCGAPPGMPCTTTTGIGMADITHRARRPRNAERAITRTASTEDQPNLGLKLSQETQKP